MTWAIDRETYAGRQERLRADMAEAGIDLVAAYADVWRPGNVFYLTNWREPAGGISQAWCLFLLPARGESILLVGFETTLQAPEVALFDRVERTDRLDDVLAGVKQAVGPQRVGLIGENLLPLAVYRQLAAGLGDVDFVDAMPLLSRQRRIKSAAEIALMREAAALSDRAMNVALAALRDGATEAEVAAAGNACITSAGAALSFFPTVGAGPNSARAMQLATDAPIRRGELVLLDFGAWLNGYFGDISRTVGFGELDRTKRAILETAITASDEGLKQIRPGAAIRDVELTIRRVITEGGFGGDLLHNIGHGIGTDQEEDFPIAPDSELMIEEGMTFTVEPGIYRAGVGGCRIEDVVAVTATGREVLGEVKRDLFIA